MVTHGSHMATPTRNLMDKSEELHGALLQLLLNTSGNDFEPDGVLVQALQLLSHACRPIKGDLGQSAPEQGENGATEVAELRRRLTDATERADAAEARMAQAERRREDAERERDECEENAARTLEEELAKASQTASAALEEANRSNRDAMEGLERAHQLQLNELRQQSKQAMADRKATSEDYERQAAHAKREQKLAEFRTKKLEEQKALDLRSEHQNASRLVHEAEEAAELAEQRVAYAESRQKQAEAQLARAQEDKLDAEERWRASINEANELRAQVRALKFEHNQVELGAIGSTSSADVARNMRRGQAMRLERQLAEAEQRASIEKQRGNRAISVCVCHFLHHSTNNAHVCCSRRGVLLAGSARLGKKARAHGCRGARFRCATHAAKRVGIAAANGAAQGKHSDQRVAGYCPWYVNEYWRP